MIACCGPRIVFSFTPLAPDGLLLPTLSPSSEPPLRIERAPILRRRPSRPRSDRIIYIRDPRRSASLSPRGQRLVAWCLTRLHLQVSRFPRGLSAASFPRVGSDSSPLPALERVGRRTESDEATRRTLAGQAGPALWVVCPQAICPRGRSGAPPERDRWPRWGTISLTSRESRRRSLAPAEQV